MKKTIQWLAVLLGAQLLLALGLGLSGTALTRTKGADRLLLAFDKAAIDRITLEDPGQAKVVLAKKEGRWQLPEAGGFPADGTRVAQLLDRLAGLKGGDVVAAPSRAPPPFKVGAPAFARRLPLAKGDASQATLYLGTSPALRRLHARSQGADDVHIVDLAVYDVPVKAAEWQDKTLLAVPQAQIAAIDIDGLRIERGAGDGADEGKDAQWTASPLPEGKRLKADAAAKLARLLAELRFDAVLGKEAKPEYGQDEPVLRLTVTRKGAAPVDYRLGKAADKEEYTLKVSSRPEHFRLPSWTAKDLLDAAKREDLLEAVPAETTSAAPKQP
jgi:hypothetical protein